MAISKLIKQSGGGTDWSSYSPFSDTVPVSVGTSYTTVIEVLGKGYISHSAIKAPYTNAQSNSKTGKIRITLDSVVVFEGNGTGRVGTSYDGGICGFVSPVRKLESSFRQYNESIKSYGFITPDPITTIRNHVVILDEPVFFNSSFKVEYALSSTAGVDGELVISGGMMV